MRTIIRIEHKDGNGLWRSKNTNNQPFFKFFSFKQELVEKHNNFPTPINDIYIDRYIEKDEYCAFKSIQQVQQWIESSWWKEIIEVGFKVLMIDVSKCLEGEHQILFKKKDILQTKDITALFINNS